MENFNIKHDGVDQLFDVLNSPEWGEKTFQRFEGIRDNFLSAHPKEQIAQLTKEDYFLGHKERSGLAYDLEWATKELGSIRGGSNYKFGYVSDFEEIKKLINKAVNIDSTTAYGENGLLSTELEELCKLSKQINGFKTGRTVLPKVLSLYHPETFLPIFTDQDHFIKNLIDCEPSGSTGLEYYLENNYLLLQIKEELALRCKRPFQNIYEYYGLLYEVFPKAPTESAAANTTAIAPSKEIEQQVDALEVQHYQTLIHRNFSRLFPNLSYYDTQIQHPRNGQFDTQCVGIIDILAIDEKGNYVVIEIKRKAKDVSVGQITRYMGWVQEELCQKGQTVSGLIVAESKDLNLTFALKILPHITFKKLTLRIELSNN